MKRLFPFVLVLCCAASAQMQLPAGTRSVDDAPKTVTTVTLRDQAESSLASKDYATAQKQLTQYTVTQPGDARGFYDLGFAEDALSHSSAAEAAYRKAIQIDSKQFEARLGLGLLLARKGDAIGAKEQLLAATESEPAAVSGDDAKAAKARAWRALARLNRAADPAIAREELITALRLSPPTEEDMLFAGELAEAAGDNDDAERQYRLLLGSEMMSAEAAAALGHLLLHEQKTAEAEHVVSQALVKHPDDVPLTTQMADIYVAEGKTADAVPLLVKLHVANPEDTQISMALADFYTQNGQAAAAEPIYKALLAKSPQSVSLLAARGENLIRQMRYAEAESILKQAVARSTEFADTQALANAAAALAFAASENHDPEETLQALDMRAQYGPENPPTLFLRATAYDHLRQVKPAMEYYRKFLTEANGKFPDQEFQARHRLVALEHMK
jgi:tetratricopeptide (TPR) repeat protein